MSLCLTQGEFHFRLQMFRYKFTHYVSTYLPNKLIFLFTNFQTINMELRMSPSKFNMTAIITAMDSITDDELKTFLLENLSTFDKGSKFTIFGGHHHSGPTNEKPTFENVHVDENDPKLNYNHHKV